MYSRWKQASNSRLLSHIISSLDLVLAKRKRFFTGDGLRRLRTYITHPNVVKLQIKHRLLQLIVQIFHFMGELLQLMGMVIHPLIWLGGNPKATSRHLSHPLRLLPSGPGRVHGVSMREDPRVTIDSLLSQRCGLLPNGQVISIFNLSFLFECWFLNQFVFLLYISFLMAMSFYALRQACY